MPVNSRRAAARRVDPPSDEAPAAKRRGQRVDPTSRPTTGEWVGWHTIQNKDADRHYVWASLTDVENGLEGYISRGYEPVLWTKDGPKPVMGRVTEKNIGTPIEIRGSALVSCPMELYEAKNRDGDGRGQALLDRAERAMELDDLRPDPMRGIYKLGRGLRVEKERPFDQGEVIDG